MKVPFNRPAVVGREYEYIADAITRAHISGDGHYTRLVHGALERLVGARRALFTTSCTHALEMAAILLDTVAGDEIIMPSYTFVSTANAFVLRGARPVFVDIRPDTLNIDETLIEAAITPRTKAIVVVHYAGIACAMDEICAIARQHDICVIEDNAHGLFGAYKGRALGSFGSMATQSFHETKNLICGEGGALLLNDDRWTARAEIIREKGTNRSRFLRGQVDKYTWVEPGSSYLASDILAAFLWAQLERRDFIQAARRTLWDRYYTHLADWAGELGVALPTVPPECDQAYHMFYLVMPTEQSRDGLIELLRKREVFALFHYVPLHQSTYGALLGYRDGDLPVTETYSSRLLRLPLFNQMTQAEQSYVLDAIVESMPLRAAVHG